MRVRGFMVIYLECLRIPPIWLKYVWFSFAEIFSNYNFRYFNFKKIFHVKGSWRWIFFCRGCFEAGLVAQLLFTQTASRLRAGAKLLHLIHPLLTMLSSLYIAACLHFRAKFKMASGGPKRSYIMCLWDTYFISITITYQYEFVITRSFFRNKIFALNEMF